MIKQNSPVELAYDYRRLEGGFKHPFPYNVQSSIGLSLN